MNQFERVKDTGITSKQNEKFNIIRGCVTVSCLDNYEKNELLEFIHDLEEYLEGEE